MEERFNNVMDIILLMDDDDRRWVERHVGDGRKVLRKKALEFADCLRNWDCVERGRQGGYATADINRHNRDRAHLVEQLERFIVEIRRSNDLLEREKRELTERIEQILERVMRSEVENDELKRTIKELEERLKPRRPRKKKGDGK